jgi:putative selenium metabolism hydrolase
VIDADELGRLTLALVGEPSLSGEEGAVAQLVAAEMERLGLAPEVDELGNVVGTLDAGPGPCVLLDSHMDTVGVTDPAAWSHDPEGERAGDRLYGRGTVDMKGPLAASLHGVASLRGRLPRGRVVVVASVGEEEVEGPALTAVAERVRPDVAVICEATSLRVARGQRGRIELKVELLGRQTHSSRPDLGVNAVEIAADLVAELGRIKLPRHDVLGDAVLVVTDIVSSPYPGLSVVPDRCLLTLDRRSLPGETLDGIAGPIRAAAERVSAARGGSATVEVAVDELRAYTGAVVSAPNFAPGWCYDETSPHITAAVAALGAQGLEAGTTHYAFCTNGSATAVDLGVPTLGYGPGDASLAHRVDEHIELAELAAAAHGYAVIVAALAEA